MQNHRSQYFDYTIIEEGEGNEEYSYENLKEVDVIEIPEDQGDEKDKVDKGDEDDEAKKR